RLQCRLVDLPPQSPATNAEHVLRELEVPKSKGLVAYRDGQRLVPSLAKIEMLEEENRAIPITPEGLYLITGGLGGLGSALAEYLIKRFRAKVILIGRTSIPERATWNDAQGIQAKRIKNYLAIEQSGGEFIYYAVDVSDLGKLRACV